MRAATPASAALHTLHFSAAPNQLPSCTGRHWRNSVGQLLLTTACQLGTPPGAALVRASADDDRRALGKAFEGAGVPRPTLPADEVVPLLMRALQYNNLPEVDSGLCAMWAFAGDTTRFVFKNNRTEFLESAHETADALPTSFYGVALHGRSWELERPLNRVGGEGGWIATQLMRTVSSDGRMRRWQWELRRHRRPPVLGAWYVESVGSSDRLGNFEVEG